MSSSANQAPAQAAPPASSNAAAPLAVDSEQENAEPSAANCWGRTDERTLWTRIWQGVAAGSLGVNLAAMAIEASTVVIVAGIIACLIAAAVIYLQFQLQDTDSTYSATTQNFMVHLEDEPSQWNGFSGS